ncbi:RNA polymerase sigma factor [Streptomyces albidoflavus]|uniref:RNA polymerase sigma factor n=1 Tax=Streptomyces TaxID=1883 RepID=UPI001645F709|nr:MULTISPECIES: RNA polymerase sigma factor [unclassified Streptomyces]MBK3384661.1 RNA polymerase sigma factor [Streptomyces sp. DEF147AK]MBK3390361.1 RNA polymerase sigma factor [Streptomyces sp. DEF1AK]MCO6698811.1 RNA polymerase sigma factor [Streptomyces sp. Vc17.3-30]
MTSTAEDFAYPPDYDQFMREHHAQLMRLSIQRMRTVDDADDALQEAAVRIFKKWEIVSAHPNPVALAREIVRKSCASHYRKIAAEERRVARYVRTLGQGQPVTTADDILALRGMERLDRAWAALEERAPRQAECVRLRYTEEMTNAEISVELGITVNAVKSSVHLGLASLRKTMENPSGEEES